MDNIFLRKIIVILILVSFLSLEGCEAFRKKFIRKKKKKEAEEQVVLEPQEYPEVVYDNITLYSNHYNLWKAWQVELLESLKEGQSYKKQIQCFDEVLKNLSEMRNLLADQKQQELDIYIQQIAGYKEKLSGSKLKYAILPQLKNRLNSIDKKIRTNFTYNKIEDWIKD
ncbi:MAG: hypothetical protein ABH954_00765 [Candidatus Omnitrophota bacterium]